MSVQLLARRSYDAGDLARRHPPNWRNSHKAAIHDHLTAVLPEPQGRIDVTRWSPSPRAERLPNQRPTVAVSPGYFPYDPDPAAWHLNFADENLFGAYGSSLLAQDELQVLEHPILASVREAWSSEGLPPYTVDGDRPTPVLVRGAERRCALDLAPNAAGGRPHGLYGNAFARAPLAAVLDAVRPIDPPTTSHILAIEAPAYGDGRYTRETLRFVIETAASGFAAAMQETPSGECTIHTGFWGCGAYGGSREAMTQLQVVAARVAGIPHVVFHAGRSPEIAAAAIAQLEAHPSWHAEATENDLVEAIFGFAHEWGESDGN